MICQYAHRNGLPASALRQLLDMVTQPSSFDEAILVRLIESLYPVSRVPADLVCTIVSALGHGKWKPSPALQNALLKWLIMIYDVLEDTATLSSLYSVLFNMLDMPSIRLVLQCQRSSNIANHVRANLCYVLAIITRRKHVKPYRVQVLSVFLYLYMDQPQD